MKTIAHYGLDMTRAIFMQGKSAYEYIPALNIALFLSGNKLDVDAAIKAGHPAGQVLESTFEDNEEDKTLRIAFDFDGVLANDESEAVMQSSGLDEFHAHETRNVMHPHNPGPLQKFLVRMANVQAVEEESSHLVSRIKWHSKPRNSHPERQKALTERSIALYYAF